MALNFDPIRMGWLAAQRNAPKIFLIILCKAS